MSSASKNANFSLPLIPRPGFRYHEDPIVTKSKATDLFNSQYVVEEGAASKT